jgi:hypothetical protein
LIYAYHVNVVEQTEGMLAEPCEVGSKVLRVRGKFTDSWPSRFVKNEDWVAFGPQALPNFKVAGPIQTCEKKGDVIEVEVGRPLTHAWPEGTQVQLQRDGGTNSKCVDNNHSTANLSAPPWNQFGADLHPAMQVHPEFKRSIRSSRMQSHGEKLDMGETPLNELGNH